MRLAKMPGFAGLLTGCLGLAAPAVMAQADNQAPVCEHRVIPADAPAAAYVASASFSLADMGVCSDADGDALTVIAVTYPGSLSDDNRIVIPYPDDANETVSVSFTVIDGRGGEASASLTLQRH